MKRISSRISATYHALFRDYDMWGLGVPGDHERDLSRLDTLLSTRGESVVLIDFPRYGKSFDLALSRGKLGKGLFPLLGGGVKPKFMRPYFDMVFSNDGDLLTDACPKAVKAIRQVFRMYGKVELPCPDNKIEEAIHAFFKVDQELYPVSDRWYTGDFDTASVSFEDACRESLPVLPGLERTAIPPAKLVRTLQRVADFAMRGFCAFNPDAIVGRHGPGAVADNKRGLDKYVFPTWNRRLERVFPRDIHASANIRLFDYECWYAEMDRRTLLDAPARLIPVPKDLERPRLIASEPTSNQFIQGGIMLYLRSCIDAKHNFLRHSINLQDQSKSQELALEASSDSSLATVDLKDASDRLSCWTVERIFRNQRGLLAALAASRSAWIFDPVVTKSHTMLRKYAPQGNATTFPLQSITYAIIAIAAVVWSTRGSNFARQVVDAARRVRVFGDDLIVPSDSLPALSSLLEFCQLKVNGRKSHYSGNFAESCGCDGFRGVNVTPAYVHYIEDMEHPEQVASTVEVCNNFHDQGLIHVSSCIESWLPDYRVRDIPVTHSPELFSIALRTFSSGTAASRRRYNHDLFREEVLALQLVAKDKWSARDSWESLLQHYVERPSRFSNWKSGWTQESRQRLRRAWVAALDPIMVH